MGRYICALLLSVAGLICTVTASVGQVIQKVFDRPENGVVIEQATEEAIVTINLTGKHKEILDVQDWPRTVTLTKPGFSHRFDIPKTAIRKHTEKSPVRDDIYDYDQSLKLTGHSGQISSLSVESMSFDPSDNQFKLVNIFGTIANRVGFDQFVRVPDVFADTDGNGEIETGDVLYSLVDLNVYLTSIPTFTLGDTFTIVNGQISALPGMMFSTAPFTFDASVGFVTNTNSLFSGPSIVQGEHDNAAVVPESFSIATFGTCVVGLLFYGQLRKKLL